MPSNQHLDLSNLSDGVPNMPRRFTLRERISDQVFHFLALSSYFLFIAGGILGWAHGRIYGALIAAAAGWLVGAWMRRSLGMRRGDPTRFYQRIRERASGSRRGFLEWLIETIRGDGFTPEKCKLITAEFDQAMHLIKTAMSKEQQEQILNNLDANVKRISYLGK